MRGPQLFEAFLQTKYEDVFQCLADIGNDAAILKIFDDLFQTVRQQTIQKSSQLSLPTDITN
jgi:hypothetical protein